MNEKLNELKVENNKLQIDKNQTNQSLIRNNEYLESARNKLNKLIEQVDLLSKKKRDIQSKWDEDTNKYLKEVARRQKEENYINLLQKEKMSEEEIQYLLVELENRQ